MESKIVNNHVEGPQKFDLELACIPSNYSRLIARELELQIADLPTLLDMTNLTIEQFMQEDTLFTSLQQIQIIKNGLRLSGAVSKTHLTLPPKKEVYNPGTAINFKKKRIS